MSRPANTTRTRPAPCRLCYGVGERFEVIDLAQGDHPGGDLYLMAVPCPACGGGS